MNKLTKQDISERDRLVDELHDAYEAFEAAIETYNETKAAEWATVAAALEAYHEKMAAAWPAVQDAQDDYTAKLSETGEWRDGQVADMEEEIDKHSDKWTEGDRGQAFVAWKEEYDGLDLEEVALDMPEPVELDEPRPLALDFEDPSEALSALPEAPE